MPDDIVLYARVLTELAEHEYAALLTCIDQGAAFNAAVLQRPGLVGRLAEPQRAVPHRPLVFDHA